jgi:hypothetical protein
VRGPGCLLLAGALSLALPATVLAHARSQSFSTIVPTETGARLRLRVADIELSRLGALANGPAADSGGLAAYLASGLAVFSGDGRCAPARPVRLATMAGWTAVEWTVTCPGTEPLEIESGLFREVASSHLHFARVPQPDGSFAERVLGPDEPRWRVPRLAAGEGAEGGTLGAYAVLGIEHILSGWDHLVFVLALLLLASSLAEVATLVTAFTVAHSLTLALASLGIVRPEGTAVEALIGCSIALVAAENASILSGYSRIVPATVSGALLVAAVLVGARGVTVLALGLVGLALFAACHMALLRRARRPAPLRAAVAFAFGLVHGFGFAGVLASVALPRGRLATALFGFNLGVEIGQLWVVGLAWPALRLLARAGQGRYHRAVAEVGSAAIAGLGVFWFVTRTFG